MTVALDERGCAVLTRTHADVAFLDGKRARIDEPHVAALNALVRVWRGIPSTVHCRYRVVSVAASNIMTVGRAYKFRLNPTSKRHTSLGLMLGAHCELYNAALQERWDAWKMRSTSVSVTTQMWQLAAIRSDQAVWPDEFEGECQAVLFGRYQELTGESPP